jgi:tripartite ATP-independent transporter DctM subunit
LFLAGVVPGIVLALAMMAYVSFVAKRRDYPLTGNPVSVRRVLHEGRRGFIIFLMPVVVVGGIVGGAFTATEGAAVAVVYALFIGFVVTRQLKLRHLPRALLRAAITSSVVGALIAFASTVTFLFTIELIPLVLVELLQAITTDRYLFLLIIMIILAIIGMFIEANAAFIMLVPLFAPLAMQYGIDPLHFGFLFVLNIVIGSITPPVGVLLFVISGITRLPIGALVVETWPYVVLQFAVLALCVVWPDLVLALPRAFGL